MKDFSAIGEGENLMDKENAEDNTSCIGKGFDEVQRILNKPSGGKDRVTGNKDLNESLILAQDERWRRA